MRTFHRVIALGTIAAGLIAAPVSAQGKSKDKHDKDKVVVVNNGTVVKRVPPGLAKKPGGMPPGQYKKRYKAYDGVVVMRELLPARGYTIIRTVPSGTSQIVYFRGTDGRTYRSVVSPGTTRLSFSNVPASLLQEIIARLY